MSKLNLICFLYTILIFNICLGMGKYDKIRELLSVRHKREMIQLKVKQVEEELAIPSSDEEDDDEVFSLEYYLNAAKKEPKISAQTELIKNEDPVNDIEKNKSHISDNNDKHVCLGCQNTDSSTDFASNQNNSFFGKLNCEKVLLAFVGIACIAKILFNYLIKNDEEDENSK